MPASPPGTHAPGGAGAGHPPAAAARRLAAPTPQATPQPTGTVPTRDRHQDPHDRHQDPGDRAAPSRLAAPTDAATRQRALQLIADAEAAGRKLTGAQLGRAIGRSDRYGRLLLREFHSTTTSPGGNGEPPQ